MSINAGSIPMDPKGPGAVFYSKANRTDSKLIALMVGKGVSKQVGQFREVNRKAYRGIKAMEWNAFRAIHTF